MEQQRSSRNQYGGERLAEVAQHRLQASEPRDPPPPLLPAPALHLSFYLSPAVPAPARATAPTLQPPHTQCVRQRVHMRVCEREREETETVFVCGSARGAFSGAQYGLIKLCQRDAETAKEGK